MNGTIKVNNVLMAMMPYGCHSSIRPSRFSERLVTNGRVVWEHRMSTMCRYDKKQVDERCEDCSHPYDTTYVESLS